VARDTWREVSGLLPPSPQCRGAEQVLKGIREVQYNKDLQVRFVDSIEEERNGLNSRVQCSCFEFREFLF